MNPGFTAPVIELFRNSKSNTIKGNLMKDNKDIQSKIFELEAKVEQAIDQSSGSPEDESRIDDLFYNLLKLKREI